MDVPLIEFKDVTKRFGRRTILERVNLKIYEEQVTTIIGLSGSGKSAASMVNLEFASRAGIAQGPQGQTTVELESIIALAKDDQKEIARHRGDAWGCAN
jgi:ABC-type transporter Mla maintaining outer membrane lipid asymmetry ATPase subunit MlaF